MTDDEKLTELEGRLQTKIDAVKQDIADDMFVAETTGEPVNLWDYCVELSPDEAEALADAIHTLRQRNARLVEVEESFLYLCKWVERGLFDKHHTPLEALKVIAHSPAMPWKNGRWDVDHKDYAEAFYSTFPKARTLIEDNSNG